jgi:hypothetical protein
MALYAFDGTWNREKSGEDAVKNTNVVRFRDAYEKNTGKKQFYVAGVGTRFDFIGAALGGVFGLGVLARLEEAYDQLCRNWVAEKPDRDIDIVGFSRGAATTLDFCHLIQEKGIRRPGTSEVIEPNPQIRFLGVWDVVAAFGLANLGNTELNIGHHLTLPKSNLKYCFHAMALDERRLSFLPTRLSGGCEVWFRGVHSDVGGGNSNSGLNDIALRWMMRKAIAAGLPIKQADIDALQPKVVEPQPAIRLRSNVRAIAGVDRQHYTVSPMEGWTTPPATCPVESEADETAAPEVGESGLLIGTPEMRRRMAAIWEAADKVAHDNDFDLEHAKPWLLNLIEGRVLLVNSDADLTRSRANMGTLVSAAAAGAKRRDFRVLSDFFLNEALFEMPHLFPFTD